MPTPRMRSGAIALIIALYCAFVAVVGPPATAAPSPGPTPASTVSTSQEIGFELGRAPSATAYGQWYAYWSVGFLEGMVRGDDPRLMDDRALARLGSRSRYSLGQVDHLLVAWFASDARAALVEELDDLQKDFEDKAEKRIADRGVQGESERERIRTEFRAQYEKIAVGRVATVWSTYLRAYIRAHDNRMRGKSFELALARLLGIDVTDPRWQYDQRLPTVPDLQQARRGDLWSDLMKKLYEFKSGVEISESQLDDLLLIADALTIGELDIYFGRYPTKKTREMIEKKLGEIEKENQARKARNERLKPTIRARQVPLTATPVDIRRMPAGETFSSMPVPHAGLATAFPAATGPPDGGQPAATKPTGPIDPDSGPSGTLAAAGQTPADGTTDELVAGSPESPAEAALVAQVAEEEAAALGYVGADEADMSPQQLGGVDFSTLELRYVSDTYDGGVGRGVRYAYRVEAAPGEQISFGGRQSAQLAADSFFTWLVLPPDSFTVNLNPDQPHRIIDERLATTDAGRVLLEADLRMKKTVADLIHPDTARGARYWAALRGRTRCVSMRQWIVPRPAVVRETGNELFILDAALEVKMETELFRTEGALPQGCTGQAASDTAHNEAVYRRQVLPEVDKAVNHAPDYADLRRVYASRVAAEWFRQRSRERTTALSHLVDSGDVRAWPARTEWNPTEVFNRYLKSFRDGEFRVERTTRRGDRLVAQVFVYGGVDFMTIPRTVVSEDEFARTHPTLDAAVDQALFAPTTGHSGEVWLGGRSTERPLWSPLPVPDSPLGKPLFYVLTSLPVLAWLIAGVLLRSRRNRVLADPAPRDADRS